MGGRRSLKGKAMSARAKAQHYFSCRASNSDGDCSKVSALWAGSRTMAKGGLAVRTGHRLLRPAPQTISPHAGILQPHGRIIPPHRGKTPPQPAAHLTARWKRSTMRSNHSTVRRNGPAVRWNGPTAPTNGPAVPENPSTVAFSAVGRPISPGKPLRQRFCMPPGPSFQPSAALPAP